MKKFLLIIGLFVIAFLLAFIFDKNNDYIKIGNLYISEIVASNSYTHKNADLEFSDYIELYNDNDYSINLHNYKLTDSIYESNKWIFPDIIIDSHEYLIILEAIFSSLGSTKIALIISKPNLISS